MRNRSIAGLLILALIWLLTACGGGSTVAPPAGDDPPAGNGQDVTPPAPSGQDPGALQDWADGAAAEPEPVLWRGLPPVPVEGEHEASQASDRPEFMVLGKDALDYSQCEISGDSMIINVGAVAETNPDGIPAWALYRIRGLQDVDPVSLNVECLPAGMGHQYSVAVADYTTLEWYWFGPVSLPELECDLKSVDHRFVTNIGNLYFLVVCGGTDVATHSRSTIFYEDGGGGNLPGAPARLVASKGEFIDGVGLTWLRGAGADFYEVWRKGADVFGPFPGDPTVPPPGDPEGNPPPGTDPDGSPRSDIPPSDPNIRPPEFDAWLHIGSTEVTEYFDATAIPGFVYMYKVRAVNDAGMSAFSNIDEGWAFFEVPPPPPPPHFRGIHGYVFGSYWRDAGNGGCFDPGTDPPPPSGGTWPGGGMPGDGFCPDLLPLAGATLTIAPAEADGTRDGPVITTQTNAEGFYSFIGVQPGAYVIFAELEGWFFTETYWFEVVIVDNPQQFDFIGFPDDGKPWDPPEGIHGWAWTGVTVLGGGDDYWDGTPGLDPVPGVRITFSGRDTDQVELEVYTDEEGFYQVTEIAAGAYIVSAYLEGWNFEPAMHFVEVGERVPTVELDFFGWRGDPPDPDPDPDPRTGIYGMAWGDYDDMLPAFMPLPGVTITLSGYPEEILYGTAVTGEDGQFAFPDLGPGGYLVSASLEGWTFQPPEYIIELTADMPFSMVDFWGYEHVPGIR